MRLFFLLGFVDRVAVHGHITLPASTRHGGSLKLGNNCKNHCCAWFSNNVQTMANSLPNDMRTKQINVTGQPEDVYAVTPWRGPGSAPVHGSGCGVGGGDKDPYLNGGVIHGKYPQGMDGKHLPKVGTEEWKRGETVEVAWAIAANHGGSYSYRLCPADGDINEACFQGHQLDFVGDTSDILYGTRHTDHISASHHPCRYLSQRLPMGAESNPRLLYV